MNKTLPQILKDRSISEFFDPDGSFAQKISKKIEGSYDKDIIIKIGVDPTRPDIHLGHAVILRFLRKLQNIGCKVVFLVGDFTARIGDPTGKSKVRPEIEQGEIEKNMQTYLDQVGKILDTDSRVFSWIRNSDWFVGISDMFAEEGMEVSLPEPLEGTISANSFIGKSIIYENSRMQRTHIKNQHIAGITLSTFIWTLRQITHQKLMARDMFQERIKKGEELYMHEMMYPVLQGIDSFILAQIYGSCDLEIGGTDQTFNMLMGRDIMKYNNMEQQAVISCEILKGTDGKEKMSKSLNNYVAINDDPNNMFGKIMSIPDDCIEEYFYLTTDIEEEKIKENIDSIKEGNNPKDIKISLAKEIVKIYYSETESEEALNNFNNTFSKGVFPEDAKIINVKSDDKICDILVSNNIIESKSEFRRLVEAGAVSDFPENKISDIQETVGSTQRKIRIGKKIFLVLIPN